MIFAGLSHKARHKSRFQFASVCESQFRSAPDSKAARDLAGQSEFGFLTRDGSAQLWLVTSDDAEVKAEKGYLLG